MFVRELVELATIVRRSANLNKSGASLTPQTVDRVVRTHPGVFFKVGTLVALRCWDNYILYRWVDSCKNPRSQDYRYATLADLDTGGDNATT